jgi:hypothetical protein
MPLHGEHLHLIHPIRKKKKNQTQQDAQNLNVIQWVIKISSMKETRRQTRRQPRQILVGLDQKLHKSQLKYKMVKGKMDNKG